MIFLDFETTGLIKHSLYPCEAQPRIVQIGVLQTLGNTIVSEYESLVNPGIPIPKEVTEIHNITDEMVKDEKPFSSHIQKLQDMFLGQKIVCGQHVIFDLQVLYFNLFLCGMHNRFPFCPTVIDTLVVAERHKGFQKSLSDTYETCLGKKLKNSHSAIVDCKACFELMIYFKEIPKYEFSNS